MKAYAMIENTDAGKYTHYGFIEDLARVVWDEHVKRKYPAVVGFPVKRPPVPDLDEFIKMLTAKDRPEWLERLGGEEISPPIRLHDFKIISSFKEPIARDAAACLEIDFLKTYYEGPETNDTTTICEWIANNIRDAGTIHIFLDELQKIPLSGKDYGSVIQEIRLSPRLVRQIHSQIDED